MTMKFSNELNEIITQDYKKIYNNKLYQQIYFKFLNEILKLKKKTP